MDETLTREQVEARGWAIGDAYCVNGLCAAQCCGRWEREARRGREKVRSGRCQAAWDTESRLLKAITRYERFRGNI